MKILILIIGILIFLSSCNPNNNNERIVDFIFAGHRGFMFDFSKSIYDSSNMDVEEYLEYNLNSLVKISRKDEKSNIQYFRINSADSILLLKILKKVEDLNLQDNTLYFPNHSVDTKKTYTGLYFSIILITNKNRKINLNYPQYRPPKIFKEIHDSLEKIIRSAYKTNSQGFFYNIHLKNSIWNIYKLAPPPPPPPPPLLIDQNGSTKNKSFTPANKPSSAMRLAGGIGK